VAVMTYGGLQQHPLNQAQPRRGMMHSVMKINRQERASLFDLPRGRYDELSVISQKEPHRNCSRFSRSRVRFRLPFLPVFHGGGE